MSFPTSARLALAVLVIVGAGACKRKSVPMPADSLLSSDASIAQPGADGPTITFSITKIYEAQKLSDAAPFHTSGGSWTFFDAKTSTGTPFGFGFEKPNSGGSFAFGKVVLTAPDAAAGKALVASFSRVFHGKVPPEKSPMPLRPKPISAAFLATDARKEAGGFSGSGGGWYATKLFMQKSGIEAEVFFNFSLGNRSGEFTEKDADYANDMVAFLADELRDGPRPKRSPATDPSLSAKGPKIAWSRTISAKPYGMSPTRDRFWLTFPRDGGGMRLVSTPFDRDEQTEILSVPHELGTVSCTGDLCLAVDERPREEHVRSSDDPRALFLFDTAKKTSVEIKGEWGDQPMLPVNVWAPDGSFFVVGALRPKGEGRAKYQILYLVGRDGKPRGPVDVGKESVDVVSVEKARVLVRTGNAYEKNAKLSWLVIDPATLKVSPAEAPPPGASRPTGEDDAESPSLSPDKKRSVTCRNKGSEIAIKELPNGPERVFSVHPDDRKDIASSCVAWAGPKRLEYRSNVRGWLDIDTMKIGGTLDEDVGRLDYDRTFTWVVESDAKSARVGRIVTESGLP